MKDRLQSALTALAPYLEDVLVTNEIGVSRLGLWACNAPVAQRCLRINGDVAIVPRTDGRSEYLALEGMGLAPQPLNDVLLGGDGPDNRKETGSALDDASLVLPVPSRDLSLGLIAAAIHSARDGAVILVAGTKDQGIDTIAKRLRERGIELEKRSKAHAIALRFTTAKALLADWLTPCLPSDFEAGDGRTWRTAPGVFSHGRLDRGTLVLRNHLPKLSAKVADFGGGWGALVPTIFKRGGAHVHMFEASATALHFARHNLADLAGDSLTLHWHDLVGEPVGQTFDHVVMNPPFHTGKITSANLGAAFIGTAHTSLKPGGTLTLVANVHLGYEHSLADKFGNCEELAREDGFKVLRAFRKR
ncbi:MAG: methyltransferase [Pseudomonadota bacterium]